MSEISLDDFELEEDEKLDSIEVNKDLRKAKINQDLNANQEVNLKDVNFNKEEALDSFEIKQ